MILKSLSRKGNVGHFRQLFDYITREKTGDALWHNFLYSEPDRETTVREFENNGKLIQRSPRHNILYHEILSLKRRAGQEVMQMEALRNLGRKYLEQRASGQLGYCAIHTNQEESIHLHMMISSNNLGSNRRVRIPKFEFLQMQKDLEIYMQEQYPELEEKTIYNKPWDRSQKCNDKEQNLKKRTKQPSKKELLTSLLTEVFQTSATQIAAQKQLSDLGIQLIVRGKTITAKQDKLKCRLKTLGIHELYEDIGSVKQSVDRTRIQPNSELELYMQELRDLRNTKDQSSLHRDSDDFSR